MGADQPLIYLIPNSIGETSVFLSPEQIQAISQIRIFFVEEPKSARRLLKNLDMQFPLQECRFLDLNEHTPVVRHKEYLEVIKNHDSGVISEAGCPCVADPGADLVLLAHQNGIEVVPLVGPSSILLALMASGLNGQNFAFNGYLPKDSDLRRKKIKLLEERSAKESQTQIFMETPYRNQGLVEDLLKVCDERTLLCVASGLALEGGRVQTQTVKDWKKTAVVLSKIPSLFLLQKP